MFKILLSVLLFFFISSNAFSDHVIKIDESGSYLYINTLENSKNTFFDTIEELLLKEEFLNDNLFIEGYLYSDKKYFLERTRLCIRIMNLCEKEWRKGRRSIFSFSQKREHSLMERFSFNFEFKTSIDSKKYLLQTINYRHIASDMSYSTSISSCKGEFCGRKLYLWQSELWNFIEKENLDKKRPLLLTTHLFKEMCLRNNHAREAFPELVKDLKIIEIDSCYYIKILQSKKSMNFDLKPNVSNKNLSIWTKKKRLQMEKLLIESSQPIKTDTLKTFANIPIMLVDEKNHKNRTDSDDWRIYAYMNNNNGDFFQYFFFETELDQEWPLYIRDFAMDHLAGAHICKKSTVLVNKKSHEKVFKQGYMRGNNPKDVYIHKIKGKQWRPDPVPKDKNTIPKDRLFYNEEPGRIFGSYAKVWKLDVWQMLPNMLRDNPEGVYLIGYGTLLHLNECKTPYEEQALLKKCGVLITHQIYKELQSLHRLEQSKSETKTDSK